MKHVYHNLGCILSITLLTVMMIAGCGIQGGQSESDTSPIVNLANDDSSNNHREPGNPLNPFQTLCTAYINFDISFPAGSSIHSSAVLWNTPFSAPENSIVTLEEGTCPPLSGANQFEFTSLVGFELAGLNWGDYPGSVVLHLDDYVFWGDWSINRPLDEVRFNLTPRIYRSYAQQNCVGIMEVNNLQFTILSNGEGSLRGRGQIDVARIVGDISGIEIDESFFGGRGSQGGTNPSLGDVTDCNSWI